MLFFIICGSHGDARGDLDSLRTWAAAPDRGGGTYGDGGGRR